MKKRADKMGEYASAHASKLGRLGGAARARALTPKRRSEIARAAAIARWGKTKR